MVTGSENRWSILTPVLPKIGVDFRFGIDDPILDHPHRRDRGEELGYRTDSATMAVPTASVAIPK